MRVDYSGSLQKNFEKAKQFVKITPTGLIDVINKDRLNGKTQIALYLIGKAYAKEAGLTQSEAVSNNELMEQLGIKMGSLLPWLKNLRDRNEIKQITQGKNTFHLISPAVIEKTLDKAGAKK